MYSCTISVNLLVGWDGKYEIKCCEETGLNNNSLVLKDGGDI